MSDLIPFAAAAAVFTLFVLGRCALCKEAMAAAHRERKERMGR